MDRPEAVVLDCDGVLTDGRLTINHAGTKMFKQFHTRDVRAIRELVAHGIEVYIASADGWAGTGAFAEKCGAVFIECRDKTELHKLMEGRRWWAVGDDAWDVPMLAAERFFCPSDADPSVFNHPKSHRLRTQGGHGVVAELLTLLLHENLPDLPGL